MINLLVGSQNTDTMILCINIVITLTILSIESKQTKNMVTKNII
jgi:hypothetical protein